MTGSGAAAPADPGGPERVKTVANEVMRLLDSAVRRLGDDAPAVLLGDLALAQATLRELSDPVSPDAAADARTAEVLRDLIRDLDGLLAYVRADGRAWRAVGIGDGLDVLRSRLARLDVPADTTEPGEGKQA